jgi:hypothetical protein
VDRDIAQSRLDHGSPLYGGRVASGAPEA